MNCPLSANCKHSYECDFCTHFKQYDPIDKRILSPPQLEKRAERKAAKADTKAGKQAKRNRKNKSGGRASEYHLVKTCAKYGYEAKRIPLSGRLGGNLSNDVHIYWSGTRLTVENKRRQQLSRYYKLTDNQVTLINNFCYLMDEPTFFALLDGVVPDVTVTVEDKRFKQLHDFFEQDDADVVSMQEPRKPFIFAVPLERWEVMVNAARELCPHQGELRESGTGQL